MAKEVIMPKMGQTMEAGTIIEWYVKEGDTVKKGEPIFKFESDKAALEAEAPASGTVLKILHHPGETVPILEVVAVIGEPGEDISRFLKPGAAPEAAAPAGAPEAPTAVTPAAPAAPPIPEGRRFASPRARMVAKQLGVPLERITGTGPGGRIVERDVLAYAQSLPKATPAARKLAAEMGVPLETLAAGPERITRAEVERAAAPVPPPAAPAPAPAVQAIPMAGVRAIIAERMSASARTTAAVTLFTEVDATALVQLRESFKQSPLAGGLVPGYNEILVLIVGRALQEHPNMNVRLVENRIEQLAVINIGVAVDTERGLLVPVIRDVASKRLGDIVAEFRMLVERARAGQSLPDDLSGGTFTITNLGMYEVDGFTPIINLPECAILGVGRIVEKPVALNGQVVIRPMMVLSLTFDHRINDGAPAGRFLQRVKQLIERPYLLLA